MRIGLVSYRCENRNTAFNISQIELAMKRFRGKADLLCFGEAFLQGFDALCWDYKADKDIALELSSDIIAQLQSWTIRYGISLATGYIEKDREKLYSSYIVISDGRIIHNYRRISKGWKEYTKTDDHYCEGNETKTFHFCGKEIMIALCGDLWEFPDRFKTDGLLIWPVYVNYTVDEWNSEALDEYATQASLVARDVLMINPIDNEPVNHGASFHFQEGQIISKLPFDQEDILLVEIA
ncbi:MAG: carbon-nitrogen hydrolase family protein [Erysipelotrichaceae bacterium]|nr:carbon-nitrogen hydrolase family protein [Erysipelotrichaceae bacterium]